MNIILEVAEHELDQRPLEVLPAGGDEDDAFGADLDPGWQFNRTHFGLSFGMIVNHLSFGLRFPTLRKRSKMDSLDKSQNKNGISSRLSSLNSSQTMSY